jgi:hypothetical protein
MQTHPANECRANALHCVDIAEHAHTADRSEFLAFAEAWYQLAREIECCERLTLFINALATGEPLKDSTERAAIESGVESLKRLTAAIVAIPHRFIVDGSDTAQE